ncbi:hypothetical protein [Legionella impletisoli]|uniref:hypothetical protein n=1 Tax=Legionella impletisoli TaxID=343510 RepID=UPI001041BC1C|nr:hypothetical protein [Legionella impletisoli]
MSPIAQHKPTCFGLTKVSTSMLVHHWITRAVTLTAAPISVEVPSMDAVLKAQQVGGAGLSPIAQHKPTCFGLTKASTSMVLRLLAMPCYSNLGVLVFSSRLLYGRNGLY